MNCLKKSYCGKKRGMLKYLLSSMTFIFAFVLGGIVSGHGLSMAVFDVEIHDSNYKGNNASGTYAAIKHTYTVNSTSTVTRYFVQGTSIAKKDVVTFTIKDFFADSNKSLYNAFSVLEPNYSGSALGTTSSETDYDTYVYDRITTDAWDSESSTNKVGSGEKGLVMGENCSTNFNALVNQLKANGGTEYVSLFCKSNNDLKYAYTIRTPGFGLKTIHILFYNFTAGAASSSIHDDVSVVVSKPISEFNDAVSDGFTWLQKVDGSYSSCPSAHKPEANVDITATNEICAYYNNGDGDFNEEQTLKIEIPKEVAYKHDKTTDLTNETDITDSTIYAINTFQNNGSSKYVKYYYYDFDFETNNGNENMHEGGSYKLEVKIDARGNYVFYIKDLFGNTFTSISPDTTNAAIIADTTGDVVKVTNISIRNILIDYTNADLLTILKASVALVLDESGFGGEIAKLAYDEAIQIMYANLQKDEATIILEVFSKALIKNGKSFCDYGYCTADSDIEEIKKETLQDEEVSETVYWKVDWKSNYTKTDAVKPSSGTTNVARETYVVGNSYLNRDYNVSNHKNRLEIVVSDNARYRFYVKDKYGNDTGKDINADVTTDDFLINPYVDVTVIDKTAPEISSGLSGADNTNKTASTTIYSYDYVIGGGRNQVSKIDLVADPTINSIYYNSKGGKYFDYEDAIRIAQISAKDSTTLASYLTVFLSGSITNSKTANPVKSAESSDGKYTDPSSTLKSDRNNANAATVIGALNLHDYILSNEITSFTGGLVIPVQQATISNKKFTLNGTEYTISYTNDKPTSLTGDITIENGRTFTIGTTQYIISGNRILTYVENSLAKVQVFGTTYAIAAADTYLDYSDNDNATKTFVNELDGGYAYSGAYVGFLKITFKEKGTNTEICTLGEDSTTTMNCFKEINKYIDTVRSFDMVFDVEDYVGHEASSYTVTVNVEDNTAPGFLPDFIAQGKQNSDGNKMWTNVFDSSACMLEIGNKLQAKSVLIDCYKLGSGVHSNTTTGTYHYVDNDTTYTDDPEKQQYLISGNVNYFDSMKLEIEKDDGTYTEVTETSDIQLNKAREHNFAITISDNWTKIKSSENNNTLTINVTYYVNPRTLLIEPIANEKVYGDGDPTFEYCVYINKDISTFSRAGEFFDKTFLENYFKLAYCTNGVSDRTLGYTDMSNIHSITNILLNGNQFDGALSRVESAWYNNDNNGLTDIQNNYTGYYNIVLGSLGISKTVASEGAACKTTTGYTCDQDYVVKIHPKYLIDDVTSYDTYGTGQISGTRQVTQEKTVDNKYTNFVTAKTQLQNKDPELNDEPLTESKVQFTIKQNVLTITANGGTKLFGEQDSNSHNWNVTETKVNSTSSTGYLNGYTIEGLKYDASKYYYDTNATNSSPTITLPTDIILGTLRREIGENVGRYMICNIKNANPSVAFTDPNICNGSHNHALHGEYSSESGKTFMFASYDLYDVGGVSTTAALVINTNGEIYGTSESTKGHSLNNDNRNYVIDFNEAYYYIQASEMIVQPGVNQGKEYAATPYLDPVWQLVVYGETVSCSNVTTCTSNITKNDTGFTGYTTDFETYSYSEITIANYQGSNVTSGKSEDTAIYYTRRKSSPNVTYEYKLDYALNTNAGKYTNVYTKNGDYYYLDVNLADTNSSWSDKYVYAYGTYHKIETVTSGKVTITIAGHLVNQTYTLFGAGNDTTFDAGTAKLTREGTNEVGWYKFNAIDNKSSTFRLNINSRSECGTNISSSGTITATEAGTEKCRNYNLNFEDSAPDSYKDTAGNDITLGSDENFNMSTIGKIITIQGTNNEYRPDGKNGCYSNFNNYTSQCADADKTKVLFEIFKREIIISFDANKYTFIYGHRYDYYDGGSHYVNNDVAYNSKNGIFKIHDGENGTNSSEGDIFVCYDENKNAARCTNDPTNTTTYDYGVTRGDTWTGVGLEFYMHPAISKSDSAFYREYATTETDYANKGFAIPAGTYFVYADISQTAKANYKFTYLGGTLTIKPKVTSIQLTSYTKEYKETNYYSYGLGTDYTDYDSYLERCMADSDYEGSIEGLITGCGSTENVLGNTYGFTVEGLDYRDTIANSFKGRPSRTSGENVGYYKIGVNNIATIQNVRGLANAANSSNTCTSMTNNEGLANCSIYTVLDAQNYDISHSLDNNEGAYLFITPATIEITVEENQTKMYGCAYSEYNTSSEYAYTIADGYTTCDEESKNPSDDIAYKYNVTGDKDVGSAYTVSKTKGQNDEAEFPANSALKGSLYRVDYTTSFIEYIKMYNNSKNDIYQGQSVGQYIITLGDLNAKTNGTNVCDVFNNPSVNGTLPCRNFNLNYYGNSAANHYTGDDATKDAKSLATGEEKHEKHNEHKYSIKATLDVSKLQTYNLNYVEDAAGSYYYINGKFVSSAEIATYTNYYVSVADLTKYKLKDGYVYNGYLYKESATGTYYRSNNEFKLVADGSPASTTLRYERVGAISDEDDKYEELTASGKANLAEKVYVKINGSYVSLDSLNTYKLEGGKYVLDSAGTHVLIYKETSTSGLQRYKIDVNDMYIPVSDGSGAYVFINGSYVLKSSVIGITESGAWNTSVDVNSAKVSSGSTVTVGIIVDGIFYGGKVSTAGNSSTNIADVAIPNNLIFTITRREVHIHTEYNVKYVGNNDLLDVITCEQIFAAYNLGSDYTIRSAYCTNASTTIELGKSRYYAVENSLAKYPWTEWVDKNNGAVITDASEKLHYNDIQYDVLTGKLERKTIDTDDGKEDPVGKYIYNFANIKVTDSLLSGQNYKINIETSTKWDETYIQDTAGTVTVGSSNYKLLSEYARYSDSTCTTSDSVNGYYISINGGTCVSVSFANKYRKEGSSVGTAIDFWYLGFYAIDGSEGREGQQKKWWNMTDADKTTYKANGKSNNTNLFKNNYNYFKLGKNNSDSDLTAAEGFVRIENWDLTTGRETYFEIVRKTIYLYAVDESKIYGTADKYGNFRVAICATNLGYTIDADGYVSCIETAADYDSETNGLTADHQALFYRTSGDKKYMKQVEIKGASDYAFIGTDANSMKIYFKRTAGENAGIYSITACATQVGITDCSDPSQEEQSGTNRSSIGDDYRIIEIAGTLTIETREITIVPDANQGFMYGNYTNEGAIPSITYKEYFDYGGSNQQQGLVNSGDSDTASTKATCLINVSGESVVCINDNQNNIIEITEYEYLHATEYGTSKTRKDDYTVTTIQGWSSSCSGSNTEGCRFININNVYKDYYSDPDTDNLHNRKESAGGTNPSLEANNDYRYALNRVCGSTEDLRYGRDVCNYTIVAGELSVDSIWERKEINEYVRMVFSNLYTKSSDNVYSLYQGKTVGDKTNVKDFNNILDTDNLYLKVGNRYYEVKAANRFAYGYETATIANGASYIKTTSDDYYRITEEYRYSNSTCTTASTTGMYLNTGAGCIAINDGTNTYKVSKNKVQSAVGEFLMITSSTTDSTSYAYNYKIEGFTENVEYSVTAATLKVTPLANQYKIYGQKDPEIKFDVTTTYTVKSDHLIPLSNVVSINGSAVGSSVSRYDANYTSNASGLYIKVVADDVVVIKGYAYMENMGVVTTGEETLNYGKNYKAIKHNKEEQIVSNATSGAIHYDAYTTYKDTIDVSRILIGNLYVDGHNQGVGRREILNGFIVADNVHGNKNYLLPAENVNDGAVSTNVTSAETSGNKVRFTIIPRPMYIEIQAIEKMYGQATDILSCDSGVTCTLETYNNNSILDSGQNYLVYNYRINESKEGRATLTVTALGTVTNVYASGDLMGINLPTDKSAAITSYSSITDVVADRYYTSTNITEGEKQGGTTITGGKENGNDLNIIVERGNYNTTRQSATCYVNGEGYVALTGKGCEDVGVYYTNFKGNLEADANEPTVSTYYHSDYWGYNPNYYMIIENTVDTDSDTALNTANKQDTQKKGSTLTIAKKPIEIVIETFNPRGERDATGSLNYTGTLGEVYNIEEGTDVPAIPTISNAATHTTYQSVTWYKHPNQVRTGDNIYGDVAYYQTPIAEVTGQDILETVQKYTVASSDYGKLVYHNASNNANSGPVVFDTSNAGYYAITRDINVLYIRYGSGNGTGDGYMTYTGDNSQYESNNYTTTFVNGILKIDDDKTAPVIFAGTEYYTIEANNGIITNMDDLSENSVYTFLNSLKNNVCRNYTYIQDENGNFNYGTCDSTLFATAIKVTSDKFKLNNYEWTISGNTITSASGTSVTVSSNGEFSVADLDGVTRTYTLIKNGDTPILVLRKGTATSGAIDITTASTLMQWFNIRSHDPGIMRANKEQPKRYNARYYFAIDENFNQRVVGDYTIYIYAVDNAGNISRATTVTLRVQDTTTPEVGNLNLYSGKVACDYTSVDCQKEENWKVAETIWVAASAVDAYNLTYITDKTLYNYGGTGGTSESPQGEYYRIQAGWDARAIKHLNWSNSENGVYMTITENSNVDDTNNNNYSKDNTINYLNLDGYVKLTKNGDDYSIGITSTSGKYNSNSYILLGNVVNMKNITHYYLQDGYYFPTDPTKETKTLGTTGAYASGTIFYVRLNGEYKELSTLVTYKLENNVYVKDATGDYILLGELKDVSGLQRYNSSYVRENDGTYIKLDQWDHYFSRDNGASWIKYDRETDTGYVAIGEDGKRLIAIKAVDQGVEFTSTASTNTVSSASGHAKEYFSESYYYDLDVHGTNTGKWYNPSSYIVSEDFVEFTVRTEHYNISAWSSSADANGYYRDRKYVYLDTQQPTLLLDGHIVKIYEYNCTGCTAGYEEQYGKTKDSYFAPIADFKRYSDSIGTTRSASGAYIFVSKKNANRLDDGVVDDGVVDDGVVDDGVAIEILASKRLYKVSTSKTTQISCNAALDKWVSGSCYEQDDTGSYVYLGIQKDNVSNTSVDTLITGKISAFITTNGITLAVFENKGTEIESVNATLDNSNSAQEKVVTNTEYLLSGVSGTNIMDGTTNSDKEFEDSDYKHKNVVIYLTEVAPIKGLKSKLEGSMFGTAKNGVSDYDDTYYYKYVITATASDSWSIQGWYTTATRTDNAVESKEDGAITTSLGLNLGTFTTLTDAIKAIIPDSLTGKDYKGKDLTYSINYTVMDMSGNISKPSVRGAIMTNFLSTVVFARGEYSSTTAEYMSSYTIDVGQNTNALSVMGDFTITTNKSSYYDRYLIQTVYYNDKLVASEQAYDANYLSKLDTSVPGVYKIVYNTRTLDNGNTVYGNPFELVVNVKPTVANTNIANINYEQVIVITSIMIGVMLVGVYVFLINKKKRI